MFAHRFFPTRFFAPHYFPPVPAAGTADTAGWLLMNAPVRRPPAIDDEDALLAWFFLEVMDD